MSFNQWYDQYNPRFVPNQKQIAKDAWDGCKKEMLELLHQYQDIYTSREMVDKMESVSERL